MAGPAPVRLPCFSSRRSWRPGGSVSSEFLRWGLVEYRGGGADEAGVVLELGEEELDVGAEGLLADLVEEVVVDDVPVIAGEAAGEDDSFGIVEVGEVRDAD